MIIPTPKSSSFNGETTVAAGISSYFENSLITLKELSRKLYDVTFSSGDAFSLLKDSALSGEEYKIIITEGKVTAFAGDEIGMQNAVSSLLQLMKINDNGEITLPMGEIWDAPDCEYRTVMIDLARDFHEFHYLLEFVDLCRFYKIKYFQLHFTDNESYTLPSKLFPKLSTPNRCYTFEQIKELNEYAAKRGISLIPEIDVPGHAISFEAYGGEFAHEGVICQNEGAIKNIRTLFAELCEMFPYSEYIHIGGDEAEIKKWSECPRCREYAEKKGLKTEQDIYSNFIMEVADEVKRQGKKVVCWEGFAKSQNNLVSKDILMISWENYYQIAPDLLEGGFNIINASWNPMYIVAPNIKWTVEEIFNWNIYTFTPVHPESPFYGRSEVISKDSHVLGGQLLAWGDKIAELFPIIDEGVKIEQQLVAERMPCLAENTWNKEKVVTFEEFDGKYQHLAKTAEKIYK